MSQYGTKAASRHWANRPHEGRRDFTNYKDEDGFVVIRLDPPCSCGRDRAGRVRGIIRCFRCGRDCGDSVVGTER